VSDFFSGLLSFWGIEIINFTPNSISLISIFVHLCEAFLGIAPHFELFRHLFWLRPYPTTANPLVVGGAELRLRPDAGRLFFPFHLNKPDEGWRSEWFYVANVSNSLPPYRGHPPVSRPSWLSRPSPDAMGEVHTLLGWIHELKVGNARGEQLNALGIAYSFCFRLTQPIKERASLGFDYGGPDDPSRESNELCEAVVITDRMRAIFDENKHNIFGGVGSQPTPFFVLNPPPEVTCLTFSHLRGIFRNDSYLSFASRNGAGSSPTHLYQAVPEVQ
jgi:Putative gypsy type transposon